MVVYINHFLLLFYDFSFLFMERLLESFGVGIISYVVNWIDFLNNFYWFDLLVRMLSESGLSSSFFAFNTSRNICLYLLNEQWSFALTILKVILEDLYSLMSLLVCFSLLLMLTNCRKS